jgi:CRISPR/Cas system CSM-associated protein Csm5 (group 7 of RAMP superfamily)
MLKPIHRITLLIFVHLLMVSATHPNDHQSSFNKESSSHFENRKLRYTVDEMMEVASKYFFCDEVKLDSTVLTHICSSINGLQKVNWKKDHEPLAAFCYEAILADYTKGSKAIHRAEMQEKEEACKQAKTTMTTLDEYLAVVREDLMKRMEHNTVLKNTLLEYYEQYKTKYKFILMLPKVQGQVE